jgi:hypothetical protein
MFEQPPEGQSRTCHPVAVVGATGSRREFRVGQCAGIA